MPLSPPHCLALPSPASSRAAPVSPTWLAAERDNARAVAAGVHGSRRAGLLRSALRAAGLVRCCRGSPRPGGRAPAAPHRMAAALSLQRWPPLPSASPPRSSPLPARRRETTRCPTHAAQVTGTVRAVETLPDGRRITLGAVRLDAAAAAGAHPAHPPAARRPRQLGTGDTLRVRALVRAPAPPAYPGGWDLQRDAFYAGLGGSGFALGPAKLLARGRTYRSAAPGAAPARDHRHARVARRFPAPPARLPSRC